MRKLLLAWLLGSATAATAAATPPEALFFNLSGLQQRIRLTPPLTAVSGRYRVELVEIDRLRADSEDRFRLVLHCPGEPDLVVLGDICAVDDTGQELAVRAWQALAQPSESWLTVTLAAGSGTRLTAFTATVGPRPQPEERIVPLALDQLGQPVSLAVQQYTIAPALMRLETSRLPIATEPPPLYRGIESTLQSEVEPPAPSAERPYLSLRLYALAPPESDDSWRLVNLRLPDTPGGRDWRYARYPWRPDWGGWLGVKGRDTDPERSAVEATTHGVVLDSVVPGGPAAAGGLQVGDLLWSVDGRAVGDAYGLSELVRTRAGGSTITCEVLRSGRRLKLTVRLGRRELWPELDDAEIAEAWRQLQAVSPGTEHGILSIWDWQTRAPLAAGAQPHSVDLVFQRVAPASRTSVVFRRIPLTVVH